MIQTHVHLLMNHLPIIGSILGALVLGHGIWTKCLQTKIAAYNVFLISTIGAVLAYLTGEAAEETVEDIQGVSKDIIEQHEHFALIALVALIILGLASLISLFLSIKKSPVSMSAAKVTFFIALISFGLIARAGYLGGLIRHTELSSSIPNAEIGGEHQDHDTDED